MKNYYYIQVTDTFAGELNYSWVRSYLVRAKSVRGAVQIASHVNGYSFRANGPERWDARGACVAMTVDELDDDSFPPCGQEILREFRKGKSSVIRVGY